MHNGNRRKFASLFSGCGGFDLGFVQAGFTCLGAADNDPNAVAVHKLNLQSPAYLCDLSNGDIPLQNFMNLDVLLAGPPCQGFSTAGKRRLDDPRNNLLLIAGRIATAIRPKVFVAENVAGLTTKPHVVYWDMLREILRTEGYRTVSLVCNGTAMGVPQQRRRVILIAWNTGRDIDFSLPIVDGGTLRTAIGNIDGIADHKVKLLDKSSKFLRIAKRIKPGQKLSNVRGGPRAVHTWDIPEVYGLVTFAEKRLLELMMHVRRRERIRTVGDADPVTRKSLEQAMGEPVDSLLRSLIDKRFVRPVGHRYDLRETFNGKFRRLQWDLPSLTVDTRFGNPTYFLHPSEHRGFTVREAARIQGFPDTFRFLGSDASQFRLIGNAVPPPLANCLAITIKNLLDE